MKFLIIRTFNHQMSGWHYLSKEIEELLHQLYPSANIEIKNIPYSNWNTSSYYFYTYSNVELEEEYDLIFVCEGRPSKKWSKKGKIIWIPCQEFIKGGSWKLLKDQSQTWYSLLLPSYHAYNKIKSINNKIQVDHMEFWANPISDISWDELKKKKNNEVLRLFLHFRTRNWGSDFWKTLLRKLHKFDDFEYILKFDNHSDLDISGIELNNVKRIIGGNLKEKDAYIESLSSSDIYFAPRIIEGIGLCSQEAAQLGNVIIGPDYTTHNEYFSDKNGMILECKKYVDNHSGFLVGDNQTITIAEHQQREIVKFLNTLNNNKKELRDIQEYNYQYSRLKYNQFVEEFKEYVRNQLGYASVTLDEPKRPRIGHLQFRLEGGQGLISTLIASDLQEAGYTNTFYYVTAEDNSVAIDSYLQRLKDRTIKNKLTVHPDDADIRDIDILFVHWCSVAKKCPNIEEWYRWIDQLGIKTIGVIYDSVDVMPGICREYCVPSSFNCAFVPTNAKKTHIIPYQVEDCFFKKYKKEDSLVFKNSPFVIGRASRLIPRKFHKAFIPMCKYLMKYQGDLSVHLLGDGYFRNELIRDFDRYKVPYNITGGLYDERRAQVMSSWDLCLYLTDEHEESFGLAVAECMALGIPIICQNKGALGEVVGDGGIVCNTMYQVLENCEKFIRDHEFRKELLFKAKEKSKKYKRIEIFNQYKILL